MGCVWKKICFVGLSRDISFEHFWSGVNVWTQRPHILNRKLTAVEVVDTCCVKCDSSVCDRETIKKHVLQLLWCGSQLTSKEIKISLQNNLNIEFDTDSCKNYMNNDDSVNNYDLILQFRNLLPKNLSKFKNLFEILLIDKLDASLTFCISKTDVQQSAITPLFPYKIKYMDAGICMDIYSDVNENNLAQDISMQWLKNNVLPKIARWCENPPSQTIVTSLGLVSAKTYNETYNLLKNKYGRKLVEIWPECTDPLKFVYEDISIAAYLLTLWKEEEIHLNLKTKQSFVDLGCGNGLLVYILSSEGHKGIGIDIRKRNIWDLYGEQTVLIESTATPSDKLLFPEYDWIIGNHSDELTPWIPVIAARSSFKMRAFLLPCCCFTFNGKYERTQSDCTKYQSYLMFIKDLCIAMGFEVKQDKLRIPSTKRRKQDLKVCIICSSRNYSEDEEASIEIRRKEYINVHSKKTERILTSCTNELFANSRTSTAQHHSEKLQESKSSENTQWINDFQPRNKIEIIKNCTGLNETFLKVTVIKIAAILLETENYVELQTTYGPLTWNAGGRITIPELVKRMDQHTLQCLKNQCGGMQTLIRNYKNIFQTQNGLVSLKIPSTDADSSLLSHRNRGRRKQRKITKSASFIEKLCYFFHNHPQGCPLTSEQCSFSH